MTSARRLYRLTAALALLGGSAVVLAAAVALSRLHLGLPSGEAVLAACSQAVPISSIPALLLVLVLGSLGVVVAARALRSLFGQLRDQRRFLASLDPWRTLDVGGHQVLVIDDPRPRAFCAGLLRPRTYLSSSALEVLSAAELRAVVVHEAHHRTRRDPLRILAMRVLADALFFLPGLGRLSQRYRELAELAADEAAARVAGAQTLAGALLTFGERDATDSLVVGIAPERVDHLLGQPPRWQLPLFALGGSVVAVFALVALAASLPSMAGQGSLSVAMLLAESCMAGMVVLPLAAVAFAFSLSRRRPRRARLY